MIGIYYLHSDIPNAFLYVTFMGEFAPLTSLVAHCIESSVLLVVQCTLDKL